MAVARQPLRDLGCSTPTTCTALEVPPDGSTVGGTIVGSEGGRWFVEPTPDAAGRNLDAVACGSTSFCVAVGGDHTIGNLDPVLADTWNGGAWSEQAIPSPLASTAGTLGILGLSCATSRACMAVGSNAAGAIAYAGGATGWTPLPAPTPIDGASASLRSVSCPAANACTAVGTYAASGQISADSALAERWDGNGWTLTVPPVLSGLAGSQLQAISCVSAAACFAVGSARPASGLGVALIEHWDGTQWTVTPAADPPGKPYSLGAVSCPSAGECVAAGISFPPYGIRAQAPLIEVWNGSAWVIGPTPPVVPAFDQELACPTATVCTAFWSTTPARYM